MSSYSSNAARAFGASLWSIKPGRCVCAVLFGAMLTSQAAGAPVTLNTGQNPAEQSSFTLDFGVYGGVRTALISTTDFDLEIDPAEGTAQFLDYFQNVDPLILPGGFSTGNITISIVESLGGEFDRTTGVFTTDDIYAVHFDGDLSAYGIESPFVLAGSASGVVSFDSVSRGQATMEWSGEGMLASPFRADEIVFTYTCSVNGLFSSLNDTPWIVSSDPGHGAIDARQPVRFVSTLEPVDIDLRTGRPANRRPKPRPLGLPSVKVTMNSVPWNTPSPADFIVEQTFDGVEFEAGPSVTGVYQMFPSTLQLVLSSRAEPGAWMVITHEPSNTNFCLGNLPGDSNANSVTDTDDVSFLIEYLASRATQEIWRCDIDRSGVCDSRDVRRLLDLLNGNAPFDSWMYRSLAASPCE